MTDGRRPVAFSRMRTAIGRRMVQSKQQAPHFYVTADLEMDALLAATERLNEGRERSGRVSVTAMLVRAVALTLVEHRAFNAVWDGETLQEVDDINVGVAIALDDGLIAPALLDCEHKGVDQTAIELRDLIARTRAGKLRAAELSEATFTLSNLGMFEVSQFTAIVTPPQVAILATGRTELRAVVVDGALVARARMTATISADHRAVDGAGAARFLGTLRDLVARPHRWAGGEGTQAP